MLCDSPERREREREDERGAILTLHDGMEEENEEMKSAWHHLHSSFIGVGGGRFGPDKERASQAVLEVKGGLVERKRMSVCLSKCMNVVLYVN